MWMYITLLNYTLKYGKLIQQILCCVCFTTVFKNEAIKKGKEKREQK